MPPAPSDPEREAEIKDVVHAVIAVLEGRAADAPAKSPSGTKRAKAGAAWVVKNAGSLLALGALLLVVVGLPLHGIDPASVPATLVEKYRQHTERTTVIEQHVELGNDLLNVQQVDAASDEFESALKLDRSSATASLGLLKTQLQSFGSEYTEAAVYERRLLQLIKAYPDDSQVAAYYGAALLVGGKLQEAEDAFNKALELDANSAIAVSGKGNVEDLRNRPEEALALYRRAEEMSPNTQIFLNNVAYQLFRLKRYPEAIATYERILGVDGTFLLPYYILSQAQRIEGTASNALRTQLRLMRLFSNGRIVRRSSNLTAWFFHTLPPRSNRQSGRPVPAVRLDTLDEKRCYAHLSLALTYRVVRRPARARAEVERATRIALPRKRLKEFQAIVRFEAELLSMSQPRWERRIDAFERQLAKLPA